MGSESGDGWRSVLRPWRYLFAAFAALLLIVLFYAEENWRGHAIWTQYQEQSAARGEPVTLAAFVPPRVPDDQNFAMTPFLAPLFDFIPGTQRWLNTNAYGQIQEFGSDFSKASAAVQTPKAARSNSWVGPATDLQAWAEAFRATGAHSNEIRQIHASTSTTDAAKRVRQHLAPYEAVMAELSAAAKRPFSRFNIRYEEANPAGILLPHLAKIKALCQIVQLHASAELAAGNTDAAMADLELITCLADSIRDEPILISHLVRIAAAQFILRPIAEGLANHQWTDAQLVELQQRLARFDFCQSARRALEGERAFANGTIDYIRNASNRYRALDGSGISSGQSGLDPGGVLMALVPDGWFHFEQLNTSRMFDSDLLPVIDLEGRQISPQRCRQAEAHIQTITGNRFNMVLKHRLFIALFLPALARAAEKSAFAQAGMDTATIACALERFRLEHGVYPESLSALKPDYMVKVPHDIIGGQPLKYHRTDNGYYTLYSVGWNESDEGGSIATSKSGQGLDLENGDWVWSLPLTR